MNNSNKFLTTLAVGGVLISSAAGFMVVNAQTASPATNLSSSTEQNYGRKNHQNTAAKTALENRDYAAWKTAVTATANGADQLTKIDTQAKFDKLVEAHGFMKTNEFDKAKAIFDELGLKAMAGRDGKMGDPAQNANRKAEQAALDSGNYEAWKTAVALTPNGAQILAKVDTQDKFNSLSEAHKAVKTARDAEEKTLTDLGINDLIKPKMGMMHNQKNAQNGTSTNN